MPRPLSSRPSIEAFNELDAALCVRCNRASRHRCLRLLFLLVSRLGDGVFWYALILALPLAYGPAALPVVGHMLAAGLVGLVIYKIMKGAVSRPRPYRVNPALTIHAPPLDAFSFPSGHVLHAVCFSSIACAHFPGLAALLVPFSLLVAASRLVLGLHYPSDVAAGAALGALLAGIALAF